MRALKKIWNYVGYLFGVAIGGVIIFTVINSSKLDEQDVIKTRSICQEAVLSILNENINFSNSPVVPMGPTGSKVKRLQTSMIVWKSDDGKRTLNCDTDYIVVEGQPKKRIVGFIYNGEDLTELVRREERE